MMGGYAGILEPKALPITAEYEADLVLTQTQIDFFAAHGYLSLPVVTTQAEVASMIDLYDHMFATRVGYNDGNFFDFAGKNDQKPSLPQILMPSTYEPFFRQTRIWKNTTALAKQLLGPDAKFVFDHMMMKPSGGGKPTPWHQDQAFYPSGTRYGSITFWIPLQDVARETGCLKFVPGSNKGPLLRHRPLDDDPRSHGLEALGVDDSRAVYCPLPAGGCTVHHRLTLHGADANVTTAPRRAYAIGFGVFHEDPLVTKEYEWNRVKKTEREARFRRSLAPWRRFKQMIRLGLVKARLY